MLIPKAARFVGPVVASVLVAGGVAAATGAAPDSGGVIHGCYIPRIGVLRVIDTAAQSCQAKLGEVPLDWNKTGPQGLKGDKGDQGIEGLKGDKGDPGALPALRTYGRNASVQIAAGDDSLVAAFCDPGDIATAGGFGVSDFQVQVVGSHKVAGTAEGWRMGALNADSATQTLIVDVSCLDVTP